MKSIYDEALNDIKNLHKCLGDKTSRDISAKNLLQTLKQAQKQEQEHIKYSKKVQEQFSNDTKRIGELESKLIRQEKLLELYKKLYSIQIILVESCEEFDLYNKTVEKLLGEIEYIEKQIKELENETISN